MLFLQNFCCSVQQTQPEFRQSLCGDQQLTLNEPFRDLGQELVAAWLVSIRLSVRPSAPAWGPCQQQPQLPAQPSPPSCVWLQAPHELQILRLPQKLSGCHAAIRKHRGHLFHLVCLASERFKLPVAPAARLPPRAIAARCPGRSD